MRVGNALSMGAGVFALAWGASARGSLLAYEGFDAAVFDVGASGGGTDFPTDDLRGQGTGSGSGFTSSWRNPTLNGDNADGGRRYWSNSDNSAAGNYFRAAAGQPGYVDSIGQQLVTTPGQAIFTNTAADPQVSLERLHQTGTAPGSPLYASALLTIDGNIHAYVGFASTASGQPDRPFQFGFTADGRLAVAANEDLTTDARRSLTSAATYGPGTYLLVARFTDDGTENDTVDLWVNPRLGPAGELATPDLTYDAAAEPAINNNFLVATNTSWSISGLVLDSGIEGVGSAGFDELRFGTSFADVTPAVPEPSAAMLAVGAAAGAGLLRRRRTRCS